MRKVTTFYLVYIVALSFVFILFVIPQNARFSLSGKEFHSSVLGFFLISLAFAGIISGFIAAAGFLRVPKMIGYILMTLAIIVFTKVSLGYSLP